MNSFSEMGTGNSSASISNSLEPFFSPKATAVIGASPKKDNQGKRIIESLLACQYPGTIVSVHPDKTPVSNCPVVESIQELPDSIDLAIAAVSASKTFDLLKPLAEKGIRHLIIVSGGFAESSEAGKKMQDRLKESAKNLGISLLGPNCLGTFSARDHFNSFFLSPDDLQLPKPGAIGIISQSGAFMSMILDTLAKRGVGVHRAVNFGNRIDIGECEVVEAFARDPDIKVIGIYLESFQNGNRFFDLIREANRKKPVVIYKGGKHEAGSRAAQAHSAALAGSYSVFQAVCRQTGMLEVDGLNELINALQVLSIAPVPESNRLLIVTNGGGMGVLLTDMCEPTWDIREPGTVFQNLLSQQLPPFYSLKNPIDLTGSGTNDECILATNSLIQSGEYDALLLVLLPGTTGITPAIADDLEKVLPSKVPAVVGACGQALYEQISSSLAGKEFPVFSSGEDAAWSLNLLAKVRSIRDGQKSLPPVTPVDYDSSPLKNWPGEKIEGPGEMEFKKQLANCRIMIPKSFPIKSAPDIDPAIEKTGYPLILKVNGPEILHKAEIQGIRADLKTREEVFTEWGRMNSLWPEQIWAEEQMPDGLDLMIGFQRDPDFGLVLLFGTGGRYVEVIQDIVRIRLPSQDNEMMHAIFSTHAGKIIQGIKGNPPLDLFKLVSFIQFLAGWMAKARVVQSIDFNPVRLYPADLVVLDAKLEIKNI